MLTIEDLVEIAEKNVSLNLDEVISPDGFKGLYDPSNKTISIYLSNLESEFDKNITLLHEFIHARDDVLTSNIYYIRGIEEYEIMTEKEALRTFESNHLIIPFLRRLYDF